jgi:hypothetical protein
MRFFGESAKAGRVSPACVALKMSAPLTVSPSKRASSIAAEAKMPGSCCWLPSAFAKRSISTAPRSAPERTARHQRSMSRVRGIRMYPFAPLRRA